MKKTVWTSALARREDAVKALYGKIAGYGLEVKGHFWEDDPGKMAWMAPREELVKPEAAAWLIVASPEDLRRPSVRYGLSALALTVRAARGEAFPILLLHSGREAIDPESLPTPLRPAATLRQDDPGLGAKVVAKIHAAAKGRPAEYRLDVYGNAQIGQWFEVGPAGGEWAGAMFGVDGGEVLFHGVGPSGVLPSRCTLEYPVKGMKVALGDAVFEAWAVQNAVPSGTSYFAKVKGEPDAVLFGPYAAGDDAEVYVVRLK